MCIFSQIPGEKSGYYYFDFRERLREKCACPGLWWEKELRSILSSLGNWLLLVCLLYESCRRDSVLSHLGSELLCLLRLQVCLHWKDGYPPREGRVSEARQTSRWVYSTPGWTQNKSTTQSCVLFKEFLKLKNWKKHQNKTQQKQPKRVLVNTSGFWSILWQPGSWKAWPACFM